MVSICHPSAGGSFWLWDPRDGTWAALGGRGGGGVCECVSAWLRWLRGQEMQDGGGPPPTVGAQPGGGPPHPPQGPAGSPPPCSPTQLCGPSSSRSDVTAFLLLGTRPGPGHGEEGPRWEEPSPGCPWVPVFCRSEAWGRHSYPGGAGAREATGSAWPLWVEESGRRPRPPWGGRAGRPQPLSAGLSIALPRPP